MNWEKTIAKIMRIHPDRVVVFENIIEYNTRNHYKKTYRLYISNANDGEVLNIKTYWENDISPTFYDQRELTNYLREVLLKYNQRIV